MNLLCTMAALLAIHAGIAGRLDAQTRDTTALVRVRAVLSDSSALEGVIVRSAGAGVVTDREGRASLTLRAGSHWIHATRVGLEPESLALVLRPSADTAITIVMRELRPVLARVVVSATRSERRVEDDPVRVEVLDLEEVEEKLLMTPGDITMMLNETSGLRVQTTSPSLGGATLRVQGLRGRYTQLLSDGLPLYGSQTGGFGLLQIPPMDLGRVEVLKGVATALYGGSALGGVVNLVSRRPGAEVVSDLLVNQTTLGGSDLVFFGAGPLGSASEEGNDRVRGWSYSLLAGGHRQSRSDGDGDGWTDLPGYERAVVRPRLFWSSEDGSNGMAAAGLTMERRNGGTVPGFFAPDGLPHPERLRTVRYDAGASFRKLMGPSGIFSVRVSHNGQRHRHTFGATRERDAHTTSFAEASYTIMRGTQSWVFGAAALGETYRARDVGGFDFGFVTPGFFGQGTLNVTDRLAVTGSARLDLHNEYGAFTSPRASILYRVGGSWTFRAGAGAGYFAPTPFTEETEVTGLAMLVTSSNLEAERARNFSFDVGGLLGPLEVNGTLFASEIRHPVAARPATGDPARLELLNLAGPARTRGGELLVRWSREPFRVTGTYTYVHSTEPDPETGLRRATALTPHHQAGAVMSWEREGSSRVGLEVYYTGRQVLVDNPYSQLSKPYVHFGVLLERRFGPARVFLNAENLLDVRQTDYEPLVRPARGPGGRWTNDLWAPLEGRTANVGVRYSLGAF